MTSKFHRILVPVDGSQNSDRAVAYAISLASAMTNSEIHLLNVQPPVTGVAGTLVGSATLKSYHRDEGMKAMASALALCAEAGLAHKDHISVGRPGPTIAALPGPGGTGKHLSKEHPDNECARRLHIARIYHQYPQCKNRNTGGAHAHIRGQP